MLFGYKFHRVPLSNIIEIPTAAGWLFFFFFFIASLIV